MSKVFKYFFSIIVLPLLMLLTGCDSRGAFSGATVKLERIDISASPIKTKGVSQLTLAAGNKQTFAAVGHYSDGSSSRLTDLSVNDWHSSDKDVGFFDAPGILVGGNTPGIVSVNVTKDGITSNTVNVEVTTAVITAIQVTPATVNVAKGQAQQLTATATYSDSTSSDVTTSVTWTVEATATATVSPAGLLSGVEVGSTTVTATKDGITSNTVNVEVTTAVITAIQVTPATVNVAKGQAQQLTATATYSDSTSSDVTTSVTWTVEATATATVSPAGLLSGVEVGSTTVTATKDGITSNTVNVTVCSSLAGACIDIFDTGSGKLFTNSPSEAYLDSIGGSATDGIYTEDGSYGPAGNFYVFNWDNANALCNTYNTNSIGGRTNWRLATKDELKVELFDTYNNMFLARGWPTTDYYWSVTPDDSRYYYMSLNDGNVISANPSITNDASCVSEP